MILKATKLGGMGLFGQRNINVQLTALYYLLLQYLVWLMHACLN